MTKQAVVLDTNIFVAAGFNPASSSRRILDAVKKGALRLVWNEATRRETEVILRRIPPLSWEQWAGLFQEADRFRAKTHPGRFEYVPDADDRKFAALAAAAGATLVTNDDHLLAHRQRAGIPIVSPREFLDSWQNSGF